MAAVPLVTCMSCRRERIYSVSTFLDPFLCPTIGPLLGGVIMQNLAWPWIFWVMAIIWVVNVSLGYLFLEETYVPVLLE